MRVYDISRVIMIILLSVFGVKNSHGQTDTLSLSLADAVQIATTQSLDAMTARNEVKSAYWEYRSFRADLLPSLTLYGTFPGYQKSISTYQKDDGAYQFIPSHLIEESLSLSLSQNIPFTGGTVQMESSLARLDDLSGDLTTEHMSVPVSLSLSQPLITSRPLWWAKRIEPEKYKESQQQYKVAMEQIAVKTVNLFFNLIMSETNHDIARQNKENADALAEIADAKSNLGVISENEIQQIKVTQLNAQAAIIEAEEALKSAMTEFCSYLGIKSNPYINLTMPPSPPVVNPGLEDILMLAWENNPISHNIRWRHMESQRLVSEAKANRGFRVDLSLSIGFMNTDKSLCNVYNDLKNRQYMSIGFTIPILDWQRGKGRVRVAEYNHEAERMRQEKEKTDFNDEVQLTYRQYLDQETLIGIYREAVEVAQDRNQAVLQVFVMGETDLLNVSAAQAEVDNAKRSYVNQIYNAWMLYYYLRQLTLYDFVTEKNIEYQQLTY